LIAFSREGGESIDVGSILSHVRWIFPVATEILVWRINATDHEEISTVETITIEVHGNSFDE
jgi:hypothetical protein